MGKDARILSSIKIVCHWKSCAESLHRFGLLPDFIPSQSYGKILAEELPIQPNECAFIPTAKNSMPHLREGLQKRGVIVEEMITHESIPCVLHDSRINLLRKKMVDVILFFSPSAFHSILANLNRYANDHPDEAYDSIELLNSFAIGSIGDTTAAAIQQAGVRVDFVSKNATTEDFIDSLVEWNNKRTKTILCDNMPNFSLSSHF
jgi:uroporphyrinogen-III synthase